MSSEVADVRPAVVSSATRQCLDEYRSFRHIVRNVYTFNLRPIRLQKLVSGLRACRDAVVGDLNAFAGFLDRTAQARDPGAASPD